MKYVIVVPAYTSIFNGVRVLYELQHMLIQAGRRCVTLNPGTQILMRTVEEDDVVIYPDIIPGNPLGARKIVRYWLGPPKSDKILDGDMLTLVYVKEHNLKGSHHLYITPKDDWEILNIPRIIDCVWVGKGQNLNLHPMHCIEITYEFPATRKELGKILQRCKTLYTYDNLTALSTEAKSLGCIVKLITKDGISDYYFPLEIYSEEDKKNQFENFLRLTEVV